MFNFANFVFFLQTLSFKLTMWYTRLLPKNTVMMQNLGSSSTYHITRKVIFQKISLFSAIIKFVPLYHLYHYFLVFVKLFLDQNITAQFKVSDSENMTTLLRHRETQCMQVSWRKDIMAKKEPIQPTRSRSVYKDIVPSAPSNHTDRK